MHPDPRRSDLICLFQIYSLVFCRKFKMQKVTNIGVGGHLKNDNIATKTELN